MNNILNEITYMDGRIEDGSSAVFVDTPAKLKLRAETNMSIRRSLKARRGPSIKSSTFTIPRARMAMPNASDGANGGVVAVSSDYKKTELEGTISNIGKPKKLKLSGIQFGAISANTNKVEKVDAVKMESAPQVDVPVVDTKPVIDVAPVDMPNTQTMPKVEVKPVVSEVTPKAVEEPIVPLIKPVTPIAPSVEVKPVVQNMPVDTKDPIDEVRQKAYEQPKPEAAPVVEKAPDEINDIKKLQEVTDQYKQLVADVNAQQGKLNEAEETAKKYQEELRNVENETEKQKEQLASHREAYNTAEKDIQGINAEIEEIRKKISAKIVKIDDARRKKEFEKKKLEEDARKKEEEAKAYQGQIVEQNKTLNDVKNKVDELQKQETEILNKRMKLQQKKDSLLEIYNAMELPQEFENEVAIDNEEEVKADEKVVSIEDLIARQEGKTAEEDAVVYTKKMVA